MKSFSLVVFLSFALTSVAYSQTAEFCEKFLETAFDTHGNFESAERYRTTFETMETIASSSQSDEEFESSISDSGLSGSWGKAKIAYENSSGKKSGSYSYKDVFSSLDAASFASFASSSSSQTERRTFVRELVGVAERCSEQMGFWAIGTVDANPNLLKIQLIAKNIGAREVKKFEFFPRKSNIKCGTHAGLKFVDDKPEIICERSSNERVGIQINLKEQASQTYSRTIFFPKMVKPLWRRIVEPSSKCKQRTIYSSVDDARTISGSWSVDNAGHVNATTTGNGTGTIALVCVYELNGNVKNISAEFPGGTTVHQTKDGGGGGTSVLIFMQKDVSDQILLQYLSRSSSDNHLFETRFKNDKEKEVDIPYSSKIFANSPDNSWVTAVILLRDAWGSREDGFSDPHLTIRGPLELTEVRSIQ